MPNFRQNVWYNYRRKEVTPMQKYIGIGFIILCLSILVGIVGIFGYQLFINKEKIDVSPVTSTNQSYKTTIIE